MIERFTSEKVVTFNICDDNKHNLCIVGNNEVPYIHQINDQYPDIPDVIWLNIGGYIYDKDKRVLWDLICGFLEHLGYQIDDIYGDRVNVYGGTSITSIKCSKYDNHFSVQHVVQDIIEYAISNSCNTETVVSCIIKYVEDYKLRVVFKTASTMWKKTFIDMSLNMDTQDFVGMNITDAIRVCHQKLIPNEVEAL